MAWLPFLLADPGTLAVTRFTIPNDPSSALRALGVTAPQTPWWDRSAQLALGMAGGCLAVRRGRWQAVLLIAMSARILLDPGVYAYYTSGVLLGAIIVDLVLARWRVPWVSIAGAALLYAARSTHALIPFTLHELGVLRLAFAVGAPLAVLAVPAWWMARRPGRHARNPADGSFSVLPPVPAADRPGSGPWPAEGSWGAGAPVPATGPAPSGAQEVPAHSWPSGGWGPEDSWPSGSWWRTPPIGGRALRVPGHARPPAPPADSWPAAAPGIRAGSLACRGAVCPRRLQAVGRILAGRGALAARLSTGPPPTPGRRENPSRRSLARAAGSPTVRVAARPSRRPASAHYRPGAGSNDRGRTGR